MIKAVCEEAELKRICVKECQANYVNTLARRESDFTFNAGLTSWIHSISLTWQSIYSWFLDYVKAW